MDRIFPFVSAVRRIGEVQNAVSEHLCKAGAKTDVTLRYLIAKADNKWAGAYGTPAVSLSGVIDNLIEIGVIVAGLDPVPVLPEPVRTHVRTSDEAI